MESRGTNHSPPRRVDEIEVVELRMSLIILLIASRV